MKKILVYVGSMNASGGIERVISNLLFQWKKKYIIYLCTKDSGVTYYPLPEKIEKISFQEDISLDMDNRMKRAISVLRISLNNKKKIANVLDTVNPDYIYTTTPMDALEVYLSGKKWRQRLVASEHGAEQGYNVVYRKIKKYIYPRIYCVSVPNRTDTEVYLQWGANAKYIPHIVTFKASVLNPLDEKIVLNIGRFTADKQHTRLLEIWSKVTNKEEWKLVIVGAGEEKDLIQDKISELGLNDVVELRHATKDIEEIYKSASVFALSSRFEGFGMVLLEAMSFGIPCISFDCPSGPRDIIKDGVNGYLIENMNDNQYKDRLQELLRMNPLQLKEMGRAAFETVDKWDNEGILRDWELIFK